MRTLMFVIVIAVVGFLAYNFLTTGQLSLSGPGSLDEERQAVQDLRDEFQAAQGQYQQAGRAVAVSGIDATGDVEDFLADLDRIEADARKLRSKLGSEPARRDLERLLRDINAYRGDVS
jgi:hypothetical protein